MNETSLYTHKCYEEQKKKKKNEMKQGCGHCLRYSENIKRSAPYDLGKEY